MGLGSFLYRVGSYIGIERLGLRGSSGDRGNGRRILVRERIDWSFPRFIVEPIMDEQRALGKIIKVSDKGWGFIISKDIAFTRIFFHWTSLQGDTLNFKDLKLGMNVEFTPVNVPTKGWRAIKIKVME